MEPQRGDGGYLFGCSAVVFGSSNTIGFGNTRSSNQGPILANEPIPQLVIKPKIRTFFPETWIWESIEDKKYVEPFDHIKMFELLTLISTFSVSAD